MVQVYGPDGVIKLSDGSYSKDERVGNAIYFSPDVTTKAESAANEAARVARSKALSGRPFWDPMESWQAGRQAAIAAIEEERARRIREARTKARKAADAGMRVLNPLDPADAWDPQQEDNLLAAVPVALSRHPSHMPFDIGGETRQLAAPGAAPLGSNLLDRPGTTMSTTQLPVDQRAPATAPAASQESIADQQAGAKQRTEDRDPDLVTIREYEGKLGRWLEQEGKTAYEADSADDGGFGTGGGSLSFPNLSGRAPGFLLNRTGKGPLTVESAGAIMRSIVGVVVASPGEAAKWQTLLAQGGNYTGGSAQYVDDTGRLGNWTDEDTEALEKALKLASVRQANGDHRPWQELIAEKSRTGMEAATKPPRGAGGSGGGRGGGGGFGGGGFGGGGGGTGITYTDSDLLKQTLNGVARARLGAVLSDADIAKFVEHYHQLESAYVSSRIAGASATQPDPESQAAAWIEANFGTQFAGEKGGNLVAALAKLLMGSGGLG